MSGEVIAPKNGITNPMLTISAKALKTIKQINITNLIFTLKGKNLSRLFHAL